MPRKGRSSYTKVDSKHPLFAMARTPRVYIYIWLVPIFSKETYDQAATEGPGLVSHDAVGGHPT